MKECSTSCIISCHKCKTRLLAQSGIGNLAYVKARYNVARQYLFHSKVVILYMSAKSGTVISQSHTSRVILSCLCRPVNVSYSSNSTGKCLTLQ